MKPVADTDLYLWLFFIGMPCAMSVLNVMAFSPLFQNMMAGAFPPPITYTVNRVERTPPYFLCVGIFPKYANRIDRCQGGEDSEKFFAGRQEWRRKDAERMYSVLFTERHILARPIYRRHVETMKVVGTCWAFLQNMIAVHRRKKQHVPSLSK